MDELLLERNEEWTDGGVRFLLDQPEAIRNRRTMVWLMGLIVCAVGSIPTATVFLVTPELDLLFWPLIAGVIGVFAWAFLPPLVIAGLNRPVEVTVGNGVLKVGDKTFERGSIKAVTLVEDELLIQPREGLAVGIGPVAPLNPERVMQLLDCVEVSDDVAEQERTAKREALRRLQPLKQRAST